jgi:hypothetical protein
MWPVAVERKDSLEDLRNHMTYHVASGCGKKRLTRRLEKSHDLPSGQCCGKKGLTGVFIPCGQCCGRKGLTDVLRNHMTYHVAQCCGRKGCGKNRLTEVLINYIITYHVVSGCGKERLTEVLRNYIITNHVASGCGKNRLTEVLRNYIITYHPVAVERTDSPKF